MKKRLAILAVVIIVVLAMTPMPTIIAEGEPTVTRRNIARTAEPVRFHETLDTEESMADPTPYNLDMVDVEASSNDGEGVYVAVLDTGLLSNYLHFFPEGMVDIKEEWGIGFTHDVWYDPMGDGNWSIEYADSTEYRFSYSPLKDDRGFLTYDYGNPLWSYYPPGGFYIPFPYGSGHGTHVQSIITGYYFERGDVSTWIPGVAPKATIIPVLVLDDWIVFADDGEGWWWSGGTWEMVAAGIEYIANLAEEHGVKIIINMSLGGPSGSPLEEMAINYAISKGVIVVAAAGNMRYQHIFGEYIDYPGAFPQVISAAAAGWTQEYGGGYYDYYWWWGDVPEKLNEDNYVYDPWTEITYENNWHTYLADFSARPNPDWGQTWKHVDVAAPGCAIRGPYKPYGPDDWGYYAVWGTSQATPHVSGIAALLLQSYPDLGQTSVEGTLKRAARRVPMPADGAYVSDVFSDFAVIYYSWNDHDAGSGFLTVDKVLRVAKSARARPSMHSSIQ
jgi:subtilisin family serine protease